jgi:tetratricopeptide (TPR) repeat protein
MLKVVLPILVSILLPMTAFGSWFGDTTKDTAIDPATTSSTEPTTNLAIDRIEVIPSAPEIGSRFSFTVSLKNTGHTDISDAPLTLPWEIKDPSLKVVKKGRQLGHIDSLPSGATISVEIPGFDLDGVAGVYHFNLGTIMIEGTLKEKEKNLKDNVLLYTFLVGERNSKTGGLSYSERKKAYDEVMELSYEADEFAAKKEFEKAAELYRKILSMMEIMPGRLHNSTIQMLEKSRDFHYARGKDQGGKELGFELIKRLEEKNGKDDQSLILPLTDQGRFFANAYGPEMALEQFEKALSIVRKNDLYKERKIHLVFFDYVHAAIRTQQLDKALKLCNEEIKYLEREVADTKDIGPMSLHYASQNVKAYCKVMGIVSRNFDLNKRIRSLKPYSYSARSLVAELREEYGRLIKDENFEDAYATSVEALFYGESAWGKDSLYLGDFLRMAALCAEKSGKIDAARSYLERAVKIMCQIEPLAKPVIRSVILDKLATFYQRHDKRPLDVEKLLKLSLAAQEEGTRRGFDPVRLGTKHHDLAKFYMGEGRTVEAPYFLEKALTIFIESDGEGSSRSKEAMKDLISVYTQNGNDEDANKYRLRLNKFK